MSGQEQVSGRGFPSTHWSQVDRAGRWRTAEGQAALRALLQQYVPALLAHLRLRFGLGGGDAEDLVQGFIADKILEQNLLSRADPARGRFRNLLRTSLDHFVISQRRRRREQPMALPDVTAAPEQVDSFSQTWALTVVRQAVALMQSDCQSSGRQDLWRIFQARVLLPATQGLPPMPYEQLVQELQIRDPAQASNLLMTSKRQFARALRQVVAQYADSEAEIEQELTDLRAILSSGAGAA